MKIRIFIFFLFSFLSSVSFAQNIKWFESGDSVPYCSILNDGKFVNMINKDKHTPGYEIEFKDGYVTEYFENKRYTVKSAIKFTSDCSYVTTVIKVTIPGYPLAEGTQIYTEIIKTDKENGLVMIESKLKRKTNKLILKRNN